MIYEIELTENMLSKSFLPDWNLGNVCFTIGFAELIGKSLSFKNIVNDIFKPHLNGNYGIISGDAVDLKRTIQARLEGRKFISVFMVNGKYIKVVTNQKEKFTVACLVSED